jgi:COP9 signalosome complex subunit 5
MGWYHSHPFDVGPHSNAFLSATDVSTQLLWQISEDAAGNPWLALVVDPLRGVAKGKPEIGAFRCYPTNYTPPKGLAPDGVSWDDERARNARWGESCISYHQLVRRQLNGCCVASDLCTAVVELFRSASAHTS